MHSDAPRNLLATNLVSAPCELSLPDFANPAPVQMMSFAATCSLLCRSRSGLYKLMQNDPTFPLPVKDGEARAARAFFVASEIAAWQRAQLKTRSVAPGRGE